jgi:ubiquinol oxidase
MLVRCTSHARAVCLAPCLGVAVRKSPLWGHAAVGMKFGTSTGKKRTYDWVTEEAETIIARAYNQHRPLAVEGKGAAASGGSPPPSLKLSKEELESLDKPFHYEPKDMVDKTAYYAMRFLRVFTHAFFRKKYDHHAVVLETVAAVPGIVAAFHRHMRSLRRMERDHGWINPLLEESENERMHLLIWMKVTHPSAFERSLVILAQGGYLAFYMTLYILFPRGAHRLVGYLEEEAHLAYTDFLRAIDSGELPNKPAPAIAIKYYSLPPDATVRDVVLHVRADECMHRDFNHMLGDKYKQKDINTPPVFLAEDLRKEDALRFEPQQQTQQKK